MAELRVKGTGTLKLFESDNTSSVTIASPASLGADRTITLPDADVTLASGTMATTNGITAASQWRLTADFTNDAIPIASNLEAADTDGFGVIGSAMSESSGVFTFPSTGIWLVIFELTCNATSGVDAAILNAIDTSVNAGGAWGTAATKYMALATTGDENSCSNSFIFDVTSTTNDLVRFLVYVANSATTTLGNTSKNETAMTFIRLGDT